MPTSTQSCRRLGKRLLAGADLRPFLTIRRVRVAHHKAHPANKEGADRKNTRRQARPRATTTEEYGVQKNSSNEESRQKVENHSHH